MFENPRRGRQARNFTTNAPKILDLKSSSEQIFSRKLPLGAPEDNKNLSVRYSFRRPYLTRGITPNSPNAIEITHLGIHLKHNWELARVIERKSL